jgi:putative DNA primase/helicase
VSTERPIIAAPVWSNFPPEITSRTMWVLWRYQPREEGGFTKVPYSISGKNASSTDPETWSTFTTVGGVYLRAKNAAPGPYGMRKDFDGIGIVLSESDPFVGWDFDHVVKDGIITDPVAARFVKLLDTYTEISPSGTGLRLLAIGKLPPEFRKLGGYECYDSVRFLTLTGNLLAGSPRSINER